MGQCNALVAIFMVVSVKKSQFGAYLSCGDATSYDTYISYVSGWKVVRYFPGEKNKYTEMENIINLVNRDTKRGGGWD